MKGSSLGPQTQKEITFIRDAMRRNRNLGPFLKKIADEHLDKVASSAFKCQVEAGDVITRIGEVTADHFYIVAEGSFRAERAWKMVYELGPGDSFAELALILRVPRLNTVIATLPGTLWVMHRQELRSLMQGFWKKKMEEFAALLEGVDFFKDVDNKQQLAEALVETTYYKDDYIIREGVWSDRFYIIYQGEVLAELHGQEIELLRGDPATKRADFFGGKALLQGEPPCRSIKVLGDKVRVLVLHRDAFLSVVKGPQGAVEPASQANLVEYNLDSLETLGLLGCGAFGQVHLVQCKTTGNTFALKELRIGHIVATKQQKAVLNEKRIMRMTHSPFLVRLAATFQSEVSLFFLIEPALGGDLWGAYQTKGLYGSEQHAMFYVACVVKAFTHMHQRLIIYRDLKPENLLLDCKGYIKVADFGLAKFCIGRTFTTCGTAEFLAPEMIMGTGYSLPIDMWALGVLLYEMMMGHSPFAAENYTMVFRKIQGGIEALQFPQKTWPSLVKKLCQQEPTDRLPMRPGGWKNAEEHPWFQEAGFSWAELEERTMAAPYKPVVHNNTDLGNFDVSAGEGPPTSPSSRNLGVSDWVDNFEDRLGPALFD